MNGRIKKAYIFYLIEISLQSSCVAKQNNEIAIYNEYIVLKLIMKKKSNYRK